MALTRFRDYEEKIKDKWFEQDLDFLVRVGLLRGYPDGTLAPERWGEDHKGEPIFPQHCAMLARSVRGDYRFEMAEQTFPSLGVVSSTYTDRRGTGSSMWLENYQMLTNAHVVSRLDGHDVIEPTRIEVWGHPGYGFDPLFGMRAEVIKIDQMLDLAILQVEPPDYDVEIVPMPMSDEEPQQTREVFAYGAPYGLLWDWVKGYIRHTSRQINYWYRPQKLIATQLPINPGNSGGIATNLLGDLIGVPSAGIRDSQVYTFMIPVAQVKGFLND